MEKMVSRMSTECRWFCIQTKLNCEDLATINLFNKQITVFNPKIEDLYVKNGKHCKRVAPLFPRYIFANLILVQDYYKVKWTPGVKRIVGNEDNPIPVDDSVIHTILERLENEEYIKVNRPLPGDKIVVTRGAFDGLIGVFESYCSAEERVKVLLELLQQQVEVEMDCTFIRKL